VEAIFNAREVLDLMLLDCAEKGEKIPKPSALRKNEIAITPSPNIAAPGLLISLSFVCICQIRLCLPINNVLWLNLYL
jgi:hypothetical protein